MHMGKVMMRKGSTGAITSTAGAALCCVVDLTVDELTE